VSTPAPGRAALLARIAADPALAALLAEARARDAALEAPDPTHDTAHLLRVAAWTLALGGEDVDAREAVAAALLHDAVHVPKNSPARAGASELAAAHAAARLPELGFAPEAVARVADAVRDHSFSRGATPATALGCALQDADRLEALGAIGLLRTVSTGVRMGGAWFHPDDPFARARALDDARYSVDHFYAKLLGLPATMRTAAGRAEAERRAALLHGFLSALAHELGTPEPPSSVPR
jgi:uncharacterized protein